MIPTGYLEIGKIVKPHGVTGELKVMLYDSFIEDFFQAETIFLMQHGQAVPYFVEKARGAQLIIKFEDIDNREEADKLSKCKILMKEEDVLEEERIFEDVELEYGDCIGYNVKDKTLGIIGKILDIEQYPQQEIAILNINNKPQLIPLIDSFIIEIDEEAEIILMELPDGLVDMPK